MPAWYASSTVLAIAIGLIGLMVLPNGIARLIAIEPHHRALLSGTIGTGLVLCWYIGLAGALDIPRTDLFIDRPDRRILRWIAVTMTLACCLIVVTIVLTSGRIALVDPSKGWLVLGLVTAGIAIGVWTGLIEELFVRGYLLAILGHRWQWPGAILVTSVLFGLLHHAGAAGPFGRIQYILMTTVAGVLLGVLTVASQSVWPAVAVHASWNAVFSDFLVSFSRDTPALVQYVPATDHWIVTAGNVSPTESLLATGLFLVATALLLRSIRRTDHHHSCTQSKPTD